MDHRRRRAFLTACAGVTVGLAGCSDALGGDGSTADAPTEDTTTTDDALRLQTLSVGGSPGGEVRVQPPGDTVLLDFFATWCAPCKPQMDHLREVRESFPDVHMLSVTWEVDEDAVAEFWREYEGTWPVATDPDIATGPAYDVERLPTLIVFDAEGTEVWRDVGLSSTEDITAQLEAARE